MSEKQIDKTLHMNQVIAISNGEKSRKQKVLSQTYQSLQQVTLFEGFSKRYAPSDEEGAELPDEDKKVQMTVQQAIKEAVDVMTNMFNVVATQDVGNCHATAHVVLDHTVILENVPATYLIFLEKQLIDIETFISKFPVLDPAEDWSWNTNTACYASKPKKTHKTKKIHDVLVKYKATEQHPAQTELITKDEIIGYWTTIKFSGNIEKDYKDALLEKVRKLIKAVKFAREAANSEEVKKMYFGKQVLDYIFGEK